MPTSPLNPTQDQLQARISATQAPNAPSPTVSSASSTGYSNLTAPSQTQNISASTLGAPKINPQNLQPPVYTPPTTPDLASITGQLQPTQGEQDVSPIQDRISQLTAQLGGQGDYATQQGNALGIPDATKMLGDINGQLGAIKVQRADIQNAVKNQFSNGTALGATAYNSEVSARDSLLASREAAATAQAAIIGGNLTAAKDLLTTAVANKFDPIKAQIAALQNQADLSLRVADKQQARQLATVQAQLTDRAKVVDQQMKFEESAHEAILTAMKNVGNPLPQYLATQAQNALIKGDYAGALSMVSPYLRDPLDLQSKLADIEAKKASTSSSYASADASRANAAKTRATTPNPATGQGYDALTIRRYTMASNQIVKNYIENPGYKLVTQGAPYLTKIDAALKTPGSVSDQDLLDSITKLNQGGQGQVTEAQVNTILKGASLADKVSVWQNTLSKGGVLSNDQRQQIKDLSKATFDGYKKLYQPVYNAATKQLKDAGIPKAFWTIPDSVSLANQALGDNGTAGIPDISAVKAATPPGQIAITRDGIPGHIPPSEFDPTTDKKL